MESNGKQKQMALALVGLVVLLAAAVVFGMRSMPDNQVIRVENKNPELTAWFDAKAREVQGDFSKLTPADQQKANEMTRGFGAMGIAMSWKKQSGSK